MSRLAHGIGACVSRAKIAVFALEGAYALRAIMRVLKRSMRAGLSIGRSPVSSFPARLTCSDRPSLRCGTRRPAVRWAPCVAGFLLIVLPGCLDIEATPRSPSDAITAPGSTTPVPAPSWASSDIGRGADQDTDLSEHPGFCEDNVCSLTLEEAIAWALKRNVELRDKRFDRKMELLQQEINENDYNPKFTVTSGLDISPKTSGSVTLNTKQKLPTGTDASLDLSLSENDRGTSTQSVSLSQPLLKGAGFALERWKRKKNRLDHLIKAIAYRDSVAGVVNNVITHYRDLAKELRKAENSQRAFERAMDQLENTRALIEVGRVAAREALRAEAALANAEIANIRGQNSLKKAQDKLIKLLDLDSAITLQPIDAFGTLPPYADEDIDMSLEAVLLTRSDYRKAQLELEKTRIDWNNSLNDLLPALALRVDVTRTDGNTSDPNASLDTTLELSNRLQRRKTLLEKRDKLLRSERDLSEMRETIRNELRQARHDVEVNLRLIELEENARDLAAQNLDTEQRKFEQGLVSSSDVAAAEQALVEAEEQHLDSLTAYQGDLINLDKITGRTLERWGITITEVGP